MILPRFEYVACASVTDAVAAIQRHGDAARLIAGGTALVPLMKHQVLRPAVLVSLAEVPGLDAIAAAADGGLRIGALATHQQVATSPLVRDRSPLLARACGRVASPTIRSMGTLGGNLCYGESASDPAPALLVLGARVRTVSSRGEREIPLADFFTGFYETVLEATEILVAIDVPSPPPDARWTYLKWTPRAQEDKALVGLATMLVVEDGACRTARLAVGGVAVSPTLLRRAASELEGRPLDGPTIARAAAAAAEEVEAVDDLQGSADYRREMLRVWVRRVVGELAAGGGR